MWREAQHGEVCVSVSWFMCSRNLTQCGEAVIYSSLKNNDKNVLNVKKVKNKTKKICLGTLSPRFRMKRVLPAFKNQVQDVETALKETGLPFRNSWTVRGGGARVIGSSGSQHHPEKCFLSSGQLWLVQTITVNLRKIWQGFKDKKVAFHSLYSFIQEPRLLCVYYSNSIETIGCHSGGSEELWCCSLLWLSAEKNSAPAKVIDKKQFITTGCSWGLPVGRLEMPRPKNLVGYSFTIKGKVWKERTSLSFLSRHASTLSPPPGWAGEFSYPYMVKLGPQITGVFLFAEMLS